MTGVGNGWGVEYSPDGRTIAVSGWTDDPPAKTRAVTIWDAKTHQLIQRVRHPDGFKLLAFSPDGTLLAATEDKDEVTIIEVKTGKDRSDATGPHRAGAIVRPSALMAVLWPWAAAQSYTESHGGDQDLGRLERTAAPHARRTHQNRLGRGV